MGHAIVEPAKTFARDGVEESEFVREDMKPLLQGSLDVSEIARLEGPGNHQVQAKCRQVRYGVCVATNFVELLDCAVGVR